MMAWLKSFWCFGDLYLHFFFYASIYYLLIFTYSNIILYPLRCAYNQHFILWSYLMVQVTNIFFSILLSYFLNILCNNHFLFECDISVSFGVLIIKTSDIVFSSLYSFARQWFYHWLSFPTWLRALGKLSPYSNYTWHYTLCVSIARFSSLIARSLFCC